MALNAFVTMPRSTRPTARISALSGPTNAGDTHTRDARDVRGRTNERPNGKSIGAAAAAAVRARILRF